MYGKYMLLYKSPKNGGYYAHASTVCTRPLLRGLGTRLHNCWKTTVHLKKFKLLLISAL